MGSNKHPVTYIKGTEPKSGDVARGDDIGKCSHFRYRWSVCADCGKGRWVPCHDRDRLCHSCSARGRDPITFLSGIRPPFPTYVVGTEPKVGDIAIGEDVGNSGHKMIWMVCERCGKQRWVHYRKQPRFCSKCKGKVYHNYVSGTDPKIGDIYRDNHGTTLIWKECERCGKPRWVEYYPSLKGKIKHCHKCAMKILIENGLNKREKSGNWKGGRLVSAKGYVKVIVNEDDSYASMRDDNGYVEEHRLVMARHLGRCINSKEIVHHKNGDKGDNRIENLELTTNGKHIKDHHQGYKDGFVKGYEDGTNKRIKELQDQVALYESLLFDKNNMENVVD